MHILEVIAVVAIRLGTMASTVVAAVASPSVVAKTVERALQADGDRARTMLLRATAFEEVTRSYYLRVLGGGAPGV